MRTIVFEIVVVLFAAFPLLAQTAAEMKAAGDAERAAGAAYKAGEMPVFLTQMATADRNRPNHPRIIYNLAAAYAKNAQPRQALAMINRLAKMGMGYAIEKDEDFDSLRSDTVFRTLVGIFAQNRRPLGTSIRSFAVDQKELIAESVAYDRSSRAFFIGSVHEGKILRIGTDGKTGEFSKPEDGLWSVLGMKVDGQRGVLWAASSAFPQLKGFAPELKGRSGIFKYDLATGRLVGKFLLPTGEEHGLGEVLVGSDGSVFATDSISPVIYRIAPGGDTVEPFIRSELFASLQGITFGRNENEIYVADFSKGIFRIDARSKAIKQLKPAGDVVLLGIDGLYYFDGRLVAIQNGVNPNRVVSFEIRDDSIPRFKVLEAGHPDFMEPTLGVIVVNELHYIANSQWPLVNEKAELALDKLRFPVILKLDLKKALKN